ncbi:unnamed protein product, partial [Pylaiella littoralis]
CRALAKADNNGYCGRHTSQHDRSTSRPSRGPGSGAAEELKDPVGDEYQSDGGSEGELPGDLADYEEDGEVQVALGKGNAAVQARALAKIPERWGRESLKCMFRLVQATAQMERNRDV